MEATVRRKQEARERKKQRLSSRNRKRSGRKKAERKGKRPETKVEGKHLRNGCGSESGKGERKRTARPSTGTGKECMRNQAGENGDTLEARAERGTGKAAARRNREAKERKKQRLSSQNPKLKRTKESVNSGGQKAKRKR